MKLGGGLVPAGRPSLRAPVEGAMGMVGSSFTELAEIGPRVLFPRSQFPSTSCLSPS